MKKRIFVTGAAGFIGFHLSQALHRRGDTVLGLDNFNDYYDPALKRKRAEILGEQKIEVIEGDICNKTDLEEAIDSFSPTHIVHLAAQAGVRYSLENPDAYIQSNIFGFLNILEACRNIKGVKLCYASSSSIYGLNKKSPFSEEDLTDSPASLYGATKKSNELMAHSYHHLFGIPVTGMRFFTVYGPWGRPDMALYTFTKGISEGTAIPVFNNGEMERDFTYIDDIVDGVIAAVDLEARCQVFNLGNHHPQKLSYFIDCIEEAVGKKAIINHLPMQAGDVPKTYADITHSQKLLNFTPKISLKEGVKRFVKWYQTDRLEVSSHKV